MTTLRRELGDLEKRKKRIKDSPRAAIALAMARELDMRDGTASGLASCARTLDALIDSLRAEAAAQPDQRSAPAESPRDGVVDIRSRRAARRADAAD